MELMNSPRTSSHQQGFSAPVPSSLLSPKEGENNKKKKHGEALDGGQLIQIIDYEGDIVADLDSWISKEKLRDVGFNFNVVTILGSQSSGKSSLMNALFGCNFQVMDHVHGHSQTTKGIWLGRDGFSRRLDENGIFSSSSSFSADSQGQEQPTLVVDVEGIDSRERGEDRQTFEHRSALFALALADCLCINVWYHSLGNFTASGYGLLKTVMQVNLELFAQQKNAPRTILLFAVRDWAEVMTPLDTVKQKIAHDYVERIWKEITKPAALETSSPYDLFDFHVFGLAHKFMNPTQFDKDVQVLRQQWFTTLRPKTYSRLVPADGFAHYAASIWEVIKQQDHLNIPNQKEMLAIYRCQELKAQVLASKTHEVTSMLSKVQRKELKDFSQFPSWISQIANSALSEYMEHACRYQKDICMRIEKELIDGLTGAMQPIVDELLMQTRDSLMKDFSQKLASFFTISKTDSTLTIAGEPVELVWESFGSTCEKLKRDVKKRFLASAEMYRVKLHDTQSDSSSLFLHFSTDLILDGMLRISSKDVESVREAQQTSLENLIKKRCDEKFLGVADGLASREFSAEKYWETCRAKVSSVSTDCSDRYMKSYLGLASYSSSSFNAVAMNISDLSSPENRGTSSSPSSSSPRVPEKTDTHLVEGTGEKIDQEEEEEEEKEKKKETFRTRCRVIALMALRKQMESIVANLHIIVVDRFQTFFSYDENDQPRQWECLPPETLQRLFVEAKEQAIVLLSTFSSMNIIPLDLSRPSLYPPDFTPPSSPPSSTKPSSSPPDPSSSQADISSSSTCSPRPVIIPEKTESNRLNALPSVYWSPLLDSLQYQALHHKTLRHMQQLCRDAQTLQRGGGANRFTWQSIPIWAWLFVLALAWNELTAVLGWLCSSWFTLPLLLLCIVAGGAAVYTGNVEVALTSLQHFILIIRTIAVPLTRQLLLKALNIVEPDEARRVERRLGGGSSSSSAGERRGGGSVEMTSKHPQQHHGPSSSLHKKDSFPDQRSSPRGHGTTAGGPSSSSSSSKVVGGGKREGESGHSSSSSSSSHPQSHLHHQRQPQQQQHSSSSSHQHVERQVPSSSSGGLSRQTSRN